MSKNASSEGCPTSNWGCTDVVTHWLGKIGVSRSLMVTLALLPFTWNGVVLVKDGVVYAWNAVAGAFSAIGAG